MVRIVYLYKDLMGLYGEYANIDALVKRLESAKIKASVETVGYGDMPDLKKTDLLYVGAGTEGRMLAALADFNEKKEAVTEYIKRGGLVLATGNALCLFADKITAADGEEYRGICAIDASVAIDAKRRYSEYIAACPLTEKKVVGAINTSITIDTNEESLFNIEFASKNILKADTEGIKKGNLFMTQLIGPLLVRNPALLDVFAEKTAKKELPPCGEEWYKYAVAGYESVLNTLEAAAKKGGKRHR
ncbi:MAG: hypothetical protein GX683_01440 [Ruminococcaceae bacterium]|nr:hypothetical protein [Oscillospiraceae bacterium]